MSKFSIRLKELRTERQMSQQELANIIGLSKSSINMYERGEREPGLETLETFADYFNVDIGYLVGSSNTRNLLSEISADMPLFDNIFPIKLKKFPLLGDIACGEPRFADEDRESYILAGTDVKADFCLRCKGDSMIGARIYDGDIVFIRQQDMVEDGEIAAVVIDDEATLKRVTYLREQSILILKAENPAYKDLVFQGEQLDQIHILGKAIAFQSDVR